MKKLLFLSILFSAATTLAQPEPPMVVENDMGGCCERERTVEVAQQSFESIIVSAFKAGNATKIAAYFSDKIDLSILETGDLYSKSQAEQILKNFFAKHKPSDFKILHKGKSGQSEYFIGELSAGRKYRVTLNNKTQGSKKIITSLSIEEN